MPEQKDNQGVIFKNHNPKSDNSPPYTGQAVVDGREYWLAVWLNKSQKGEHYFKMKYTPKDEQQSQPQQQAGGGGDDSDIPFTHDAFSL